MSGTSERAGKRSRQKLDLLIRRLGDKKKASKGPKDGIPVLPRETAPAHFQPSFAQQRLWLLDQLHPGTAVYNIAGAIDLAGDLDPNILQKALEVLCARHESLRTSLGVPSETASAAPDADAPDADAPSAAQNGPRQVVAPPEPFVLPRIDLTGRPEEERKAEAERLETQEARKPFDLGRGPLLRVTLLRLEASHHRLLVTLHHAIADGWSLGIVLRELATLYDAERHGRPRPLADLPVQYADVAAWQRRVLQGDKLQRDLDYWRRRLDGVSTLELPTDRPRPAKPAFRGQRLPVALEAPLASSLRRLAQAQGTTLFTVLETAFAILLARLSGQQDIAVGMPVAGRRRKEMEGLVGLFVNTSVLRHQLQPGQTFLDLLAAGREVVLGADAHQEVPFEKLVEELQPERHASTTPFFQVVMAFEAAALSEMQVGDVTWRPREVATGTSKFDLTFNLGETAEADGPVRGSVELDLDLFDVSTVERWWQHYRTLLEAVVADAAMPWERLPLLDSSQRRQLLAWNGRPTPADLSEATICGLVAQQARLHPDHLAVVDGDGGAGLTYGRLEARSNQLAHHLVALGAVPESLVGVCMERSVDLVVALLAVLKSGAAYLPLDLAYPADRLAFMLEDSGARWLLSESSLAERLPTFHGDTVYLDTAATTETLDALPTTAPTPAISGDNLAYVIYTSGSTGKPKGVLIPHRHVARLLAACDDWFSFGREDRWTFFHSHAFDFSVWEIWGALTTGGRLVVVPYWVSRSPDAFYELLADQGVTVLNQTPSAFRQLVEVARPGAPRKLALREVIFGGEALDLSTLRPWFERFGDQRPRLVNMYGITETTVHVTFRPLTAADAEQSGRSPIGEAIPDLSVHIVDAAGEVQPIGVAGEMWVGGAGLARGYLGRPRLTAERFVPHPFSTEPGARAYRSGDLARYLPDGDIDFLGRIDHQVKLRGFRIELGEIEARLQEQDAVAEAAVLVREIQGDDQLVAYWVPRSGLHGDALPSVASLRRRLGEHLPDYMIPAFYLQLDTLPLTANGKLDRRALPLPQVEASAAEYVAPSTPTESTLCAVWAETLGVERVGVHDDFFALGGHSLLATQIMARLRQSSGVDVPLRHLFEGPTVEALATVVDGMAGRESRVLPPVEPRASDAPAVLSFAQERLWFLDQLEPGSAVYNIPVQVRLRGALDVDAFRDALNRVVERHEILRTVFRGEDGDAHQVIRDGAPLELPVDDLSHLGEGAADEADRRAQVEAHTPFDLAAGPLLRGDLLRLADDEHRLVLNLHHIVADGWSVGVLLSELVELYGATLEGREATLKPLPVQYADVAVWQRRWLQDGALDASLEALGQQLAEVPVLELPTDRPRSAVARQRGGTLPVRLDAQLSAALVQLAERQGVTPYILLLAAFGTLLSRLTHQHDVAIGSPVANRRRVEMEGLIGCFVNTLVQRLDLSGEPSFEELLQRTRRVALASDEHQDVPFEQVVAAVEGERQLATSPLFQAMLVLQNAPFGKTSLPGLELEPLPLDSGTSKFDLTLALGESLVGSGQGLEGHFEYDADLFDVATVARWWGHFEVLLEGILEDASRPIWQFPLIREAQRRQLLVEWNTHDAAVTWRHDGADTVTDLFAAQVARTPEVDALCFQGSSWTYRELARRVWFLAHRLQELGVGPDRVVGVCLDRRPEMIIAMLAAQAAGGAYVPLDPNYPAQRLGYILEDTAAPVILTRDALRHILPDHDGTVICLDDDAFADLPDEVAAPVHGAGWENLAHLIYTSGSTGRPKGVAIAHRSSVILMHWARQAFSADDLAGMMAATSINFDLSVFEILVPLCWGGTVILAENALELPSLPDRDRIRLVNTVPSAMAELVRQGGIPDGVRIVNLAGEPLRRALVDGIYDAAHVEGVYNLYGPSEDTTYSTYTKVPSGTSAEPTIGRPLVATQAYVLDAHLQPVPLGVVGELYLGGDGVARGYLGRPGMTAERFVPDHLGGRPGARLYRTGDLVRYLPSSEMLFLGRVDHQVKIRGFRIELGEIESALLAQAEIRDTVVMARQDREGDPRLVAYVTSGEGNLDTEALRSRLAESLPEYMLPAAFVVLDAMPLLPNGKINRKALPAPEWRGDETQYMAPGSATEERLVTIWQEVLDVPRVGVHDNFFSLGGHSLLATQITTRIRRQLEVDLPLRQLFEAPTVAELAQRVDASKGPSLVLPPLEASGDRGSAPLSFAQERLWFLDQLDPGRTTYNIPALVRLHGDVNVEVLQRALVEVVSRHDALRTVIRRHDEEALQVVLDATSLELPLDDLRSFESPPEEGRRRARHEAEHSFDLAQGPLLRARLLRLTDDTYWLVLVMHHIVSDGWSVSVLLRELTVLYSAFASEQPSPLEPLPLQYVEFARWQRRWLSGDLLETQLSFWRQTLDGVPTLELPTDRPRPSSPSQRGAIVQVHLQPPLADGLRQLATEHGVSLFMVLLASYGALLSRLSGQLDVAIGNPIANRRRARLEGMIGMFVNTLVARLDLSGRPDVATLLQRCRRVVLDADSHQDVPFEKIVAEMQADRHGDRTPLFQAALVLQNMPVETPRLPGVDVDILYLDNGTTKFDLTLILGDLSSLAVGDGLGGFFEYDTDLFDASTIERWRDAWVHILQGMLESPQRSVETLPLLSPAQQAQVMDVLDVRRVPYPAEDSLAKLFRQQARRCPETVALVFEDAGGQVHTMTYSDLDAASDRLALHLLDLGVGPEQLVGLCAERSLEMIVATLAVLKAGGAYLPLEPSYPQERLAWMMEDGEVRVLLAQQHLVHHLPGRKNIGHTVVLDGPEATWRQREAPCQPPDPPVHGRHLAYLMYTSGSTGRPKGVAVEQRSVSRLVCGSRFGDWRPERVFLGYAPISFDAATLEIWAPLLNGGRLVLAPPQQLSIAELAAVIERHGVDSLWLTAGLFHQMVEDGPLHRLRTLRQWFAGGDVLSPSAVRKALEALPQCRLHNGYGPTENTTFTTTHAMDDPSDVGETVSIGQPISNTGVQILDGSFQPVPVGVFGQLCASGDGLARGYHRRPALTAEKWVPDPLSEEPGARIYLTGDRARYLDNGELEFQGRIDRQVKVRGFRIEPGEVELQVASQPEVRQAAIVVLDDPPRGKRLVAFVVPHEAHRGDAMEELLRRRLGEMLPPYMVPSAFQVLDDELPLDSNGKVDRKALSKRPIADIAAPTSEVLVAPRNAVETQLAELWCEILGLDTVSVEADFFELGGHSLMATQLVSRIRKIFGVDVPLRHLFQSPTVSALAEVLQQIQGLGEGVLEPTDGGLGDRDLRLSFAQERLWLLDRFEPGNPAYNMPFALRLIGPVDSAALEASMEQLVARHESLRTVYADVDGYPVQHILPDVAAELPLHDLSSLQGKAQEDALKALTAEEAQTSFDLATGPVFRVRLVRLAAQRHVLLFNIHHIASDGWSMGLLTRDLGAFYAAETQHEAPVLPPLPVRYVDYAQWQRKSLQGDVLKRQVEYWKGQLADLPASLELPTDRPRPAVRSFTGDQRSLVMPSEVLDGLKRVSQRHGGTLFMTLLAAFQVLLSRLSGQVDLAVGTPIAGRQREDVENLVGIFLNTMVLRGDLSGNPSFEGLLERVRETTLAAYAHQDVPFEKLLDELQPERDMARTPFFQVFFNMVNMPLEPLRLSGLAIEPEGQPEAASKFDLTVYAREDDGRLSFEWVFNSRLFDAGRIEEMLAQYETLLRQVARHPQTAIDRLSLRTPCAGDVLPDPAALLDDGWRGAVHEHLTQRARQHPERSAVRDHHGSWTYRDLESQSNRLAHWLRSVGVDAEDPVAILAHRSATLVWAVQGVLKSGGAFVLLDPAYPATHLVKTVERAQPKAWLQLADAGELPEDLETTLAIWGCPRLTLPAWHGIDAGSGEGQPQELMTQPETAPSVPVGPDDLAYISFTSGSTGVPKGILGRHGPLTHFLPFQQEQFGLGEDDVYSMLSGLAHDPLQRDMFTPICLGASLTIPQPERMFNAGYLAGWMLQENVTIAHMTPAMGQVLTEPPSTGASQPLTDLRFAFVTGDVLTQRDVVRLRRLAPNVRCTNSYGSTETQRAVAFNEAPEDLGKDGKLIMPLGKGMRDVQLLVVNRAGDLAGIGELGEVWLRSPHLSRGYLGDAELTADRFLVNPFQDDGTRSVSDRVYRTGDLGRYQSDGTVVFAGRADHQVKIRGFRIELGEIEGQLAKLPGVREAVVQVRGSERGGGRRLLAMLVRDPGADTEATSTGLREALRRRLPEYMVPAGYVFLERLPLTPNGKLDRRALAQIEDSDREIQMAFKAPRTEMEVALADILKEVLQVERVGADDNFFDLGGNSLLLVQFNNRIQQLIGREIQAVEIFNHPTVASLATFLTQTEGGGQPPAEAVVEDRTEQLKSGRNRLKARLAKRRRP